MSWIMRYTDLDYILPGHQPHGTGRRTLCYTYLDMVIQDMEHELPGPGSYSPGKLTM